MKYLIQPLEQNVICQDFMFRPKNILGLDSLNEDLSFDKQITTSRGQEGHLSFLRRCVQAGHIKPGGWVVVETSDMDGWGDIWPQAMRKLGNKETLNLQTKK